MANFLDLRLQFLHLRTNVFHSWENIRKQTLQKRDVFSDELGNHCFVYTLNQYLAKDDNEAECVLVMYLCVEK